jgi:chromosome segregation ATPase
MLAAQIAQNNALIQDLTAQQAANLAAVNGRINVLQTQITISLALIANNTADIEAANEQIAATQSDLATLTSRVDKLEGVNKIWRANFHIVNATFAELRRKLKFVIPIIHVPAYVHKG